MLNFYTSIKFTVTITIITFYSLVLNSGNYFNFTDLNTRIWLNEFFLNTYYFYWTSFWYLLAVIVLLKLVFIIVYLRYSSFHVTILTLFLLFYTFTILEYYGYNYFTLKTLKPEYQINSLLTNSINKYHPFIFYFTLTWLYVTNLHTLNTYEKNPFGITFGKLYVTQRLGFFLPMIYTTLGLGSWWALQEGSWGGWWNWDSSEVFGLIVMLFYVQLVHKPFVRTSWQTLNSLTVSSVLILFLVYTLIQLNFDLVSHNFGTKASQFISSDQFFYIFMFITSAFTVTFVISHKSGINNFGKVLKLKSSAIKVLVFTLSTFSIIALSFAELINNFYWLIFSSNFMNILNVTIYYSPLILLLLYLSTTRLNSLLLTVFFLLTYSLETAYLLCASVVLRGKIHTIHLLAYIFIFISYQSLNQSVVGWNYITCNNYVFLSHSLLDINNTFIKLNTTYIETPSIGLLDNQLVDLGWNFIQWSTNQQAHTFQHSLSSSLVFQGLFNSLLEYLHNILVFDYCSQTLGVVVVLSVLLLSNMQRRKTLILF
jgi:hypothetical protein